MTSANRDEIFVRVSNVFKDAFYDDDLIITEATSAADIEDWDSVRHVTIMVMLEQEFELHFQPSVIAKLQNVGAMLNFIMDSLNNVAAK